MNPHYDRPHTRTMKVRFRSRPTAWAAAILVGSMSIAPPASGQVDPDGTEFQVNQHTSGQQVLPSVAHSANQWFVAVWSSDGTDGAGSGIVGRRFSANGSQLRPEFTVNTYTTGSQTQPVVGAGDAGQFVVVWTNTEAQDGNGFGIFGQRFNATNGRVGSEFQVNAVTTGNQQTPDVAVLPDGSFITVWRESRDGSGTSITGRRFDANAIPLANNFTVNSGTVGDQILPAISADDDGSFVVTFASYGGDDPADVSTAGVFARRFDSNGAPIGDDFQVNSYTTGSQTSPDVGMQPGGGFVVAWEDAGQFERRSILARLYDATGTAASDEVIIGADADYVRENPHVAVGGDGSFVVTWESAPQDGSSRGTFARRFSAAGTPLGEEFQVNSFTPGSQYNAAIADNGLDSVVVVWQSPHDGSADGIFAQGFTTSSGPTGSCGDPVALTATFQANTHLGRAVTATDALAILQASVGLLACDLCVCDVNGSGTLSASDALVTLQFSVGQSGSLLCPPCS